MGQAYRPRNTAPTCAIGVYCATGLAVTGGTSIAKTASYNSGSDATIYSISLLTGEIDKIAVMIQLDPGLPGVEHWHAGDWTTVIDVTTANANIDWKGQYICRLDSGCANQATVGFSSNPINLGTVGAKSQITQCLASNRVGGTSDTPIVLMYFTNLSTKKGQSVSFRLNGLWTTPLKPRRMSV